VYSNVTFASASEEQSTRDPHTGVLPLNSPGGILSAIAKIPSFDPFEKLLNLCTWTLLGTATDPRGGHRHAPRFFGLKRHAVFCVVRHCARQCVMARAASWRARQVSDKNRNSLNFVRIFCTFLRLCVEIVLRLHIYAL